MIADLASVNRDLEEECPALWAAFSPLGRRLFFPPDVPAQAAEASGTTYNGTTGQFTDGHGSVLAPRALRMALSGLPAHELDPAILYSPIQGRAEVRQLWRERQRREVPLEIPSTMPISTLGIGHALAVLADLFGGEGRSVIVPSPSWGNYLQTFTTRTGAKILPSPFFEHGRFATRAHARVLQTLPRAETALLILNLPSNPAGYMPTAGERDELRTSLLEAAENRSLIVVCDDAYNGLVHEQGIPARSMFWDLIGLHDNLIPIKADGATKELCFFGGRVGFLTFPYAPESRLAIALENKVKGAIRATLGSTASTTQMVLTQALREPDLGEQMAEIRSVLAARFRVLRECLGAADPSLLRPLPCNSGAFVLVEIPDGVDPDQVRRHLIEHHDTGLVSVPPRYLRIAYCSTDIEALPELVRRTEKGIAECLKAMG